MNGPSRRQRLTRVGSSSFAGCERFEVTSSIVGQTYSIDLARPLIPPPAGRSIPVIYVLDANTLFFLTCQIARLLETGAQNMLPAVVVGIGYPTEFSPKGNLIRRARRVMDLTPTDDSESVKRIFGGADGLPCSLTLRGGGSTLFREFIKQELQPIIRSEMETDNLDETLVGMSLGGLFALETLFRSPSMFRRWIAISPSVWWDGRVLLETEFKAPSWPGKPPLRVFLGVGGAEDSDMRLGALELSERLRGRQHDGIDFEYREFPGENHQSTFPVAISHGLRWVFESQDQ